MNFLVRIVAFSICASFSCLSLVAQEVAKQQHVNLETIHQNPGWRFITDEFIQDVRSRAEQLHGPRTTVLGVVERPDASPAAGAFVMLRVRSNSSFVSRFRLVNGVTTHAPSDVFAVGWTDHAGVFKFQQQPTPWIEPLRPLDWEIVILADGCAVEVRKFPVLDGRARIERFQLQRSYGVKGKLIDANDQPVPNVTFSLMEFVNPYRNANGFADIEWSLLFSEISFNATTDKEGAFDFSGLPKDRVISFVMSPSVSIGLPHTVRVMTSTDMDTTAFIPKNHPRVKLVRPCLDQEFMLRASKTHEEISSAVEKTVDLVAKPKPSLPTRSVIVKVVDAKTGAAIQGVAVKTHSGSVARRNRLRLELGDPATDANGKVVLNLSPEKDYTIAATGRCFGYVTHFDRLTTSTTEYTTDLPANQWIRHLKKGRDDAEVTFEMASVAKSKIQVRDAQGNPVQATLVISPADYDDGYYQLPEITTDPDGMAEFSVRPVFFNVRVVAKTEDGRVGTTLRELPADFQSSEVVSVIVESPDAPK
ncbi:hypothetical protein [Planctomycetes bacterium K23_9]|uniref:Nickel uptake substrate-specific transmembrane region n=1 Tax=Stieleria marina TaxID=1930275 RepID=A0A517NN08_9BACT|nr:hypothetical protein K239x_04510 [Planctomycetes bacterium K23_9]